MNPGVLAATLGASLGLERKWLKEHMRKLKELGLTESLAVGTGSLHETVMKRLKT